MVTREEQPVEFSTETNDSSSRGWLDRLTHRLSSVGASSKRLAYQKISSEAKRIQSLSKREDFLSTSLQIWTQSILPYWTKYDELSRPVNSEIYRLWWHGLPPRKSRLKLVHDSILRVFIRHSRKGLANGHRKRIGIDIRAVQPVRSDRQREADRCQPGQAAQASPVGLDIAFERNSPRKHRTDPTRCLTYIPTARIIPTAWPVSR